MVTKTLYVTVVAKDDAAVEQMIEALARAACDVSNSTDDDDAHILIMAPPEPILLGIDWGKRDA